jgi:hypothetical protein
MFNRTLPFGQMRCNFLTFKRAVDTPTSVLAKTVRFLEQNGPTTRERICREALGFKDGVYHDGTVTHVSRGVKGWNTNEFALMVGAGFIQKHRIGRTWVYSLGYPAEYVSR